MIKSSLALVCGIFLYLAGNAQTPKRPEWLTINSPQLKCWECKDRLDKYLTREKGPNNDSGIMKWQITLSTGTIRIQYNPTLIDSGYIKTVINNAGFDAGEAKATEDSYKKLPPVCKRPEEGGGPQKGKPCHMPPMPK